MPIFTVRHVTTYHYKRPVAFGEHRMMLRPRDDEDQKVLESELEIRPEPSELSWTRDVFGNHVTTAHFENRASELRFESTIRLDHTPAGFSEADIEEFAQTYPFAYWADEGTGPVRFGAPLFPCPALDHWAASFLRPDGSADTCDLLVEMTQTINRTFKHVPRHDKGIEDPVQTLLLMSGSCRDFAMLMMAALRSLGSIRGLFPDICTLPMTAMVSSPAATPMPGSRSTFPARAGSTSILRAAGWELKDLVRVAVAHEPREAIPLQGTWVGAHRIISP